MVRVLWMLLADTAAQDFGEYGIALAVIAAGVVLAAALIGGDVASLWNGRAGVFAAL